MREEMKVYEVELIIVIGKLIVKLMRRLHFPKEKIHIRFEKYQENVNNNLASICCKESVYDDMQDLQKEVLELEKEIEILKSTIISLLKIKSDF